MLVVISPSPESSSLVISIWPWFKCLLCWEIAQHVLLVRSGPQGWHNYVPALHLVANLDVPDLSRQMHLLPFSTLLCVLGGWPLNSICSLLLKMDTHTHTNIHVCPCAYTCFKHYLWGILVFASRDGDEGVSSLGKKGELHLSMYMYPITPYVLSCANIFFQ